MEIKATDPSRESVMSLGFKSANKSSDEQEAEVMT